MIDEASEFRALVADWLAGMLVAPLDAATVARYWEPGTEALLDALIAELGCDEAIGRMRAALLACESPRTVALDLSVAYTRLFEGVTGSVAVPLYESAYTGTCLFDQAARDMAELLPRVGMAVRRGCGEPPDHVSVELALLSSLLRKGDADNCALLEARLRRWIPRFAASCKARDPDGFYRAIATVLGLLFSEPSSPGGGADVLPESAERYAHSEGGHSKKTGNFHAKEQ
ncbi:TorD/DmsD family molecular chaperone [Burkholderia mayonis]|uniref:TorD/DmsD family molecular chaperone n=1 Tax=Burkholderia mayonis TaxID=1385591 RepID=UPI0009E9543A|nr:molecular chaperone TorD family protein [Burkholderia mayonis]